MTATLHRFLLEVADIDRGVYESLDLRVARHPSEDEERVVVRVLARALAHEEGLEFGRGLSDVEEPALHTHTPTGGLRSWIDVGVPSAERLHRASKRAEQVVVVTHKQSAALRREWSSRSIHRAGSIALLRLPPPLVAALAESLPRTVTWYVTLQDQLLSVAVGDANVDGALTRTTVQAFLDDPAA